MTDHQMLRQLANNATHGHWDNYRDIRHPDQSILMNGDGDYIGTCADCGTRAEYSDADAAFIAEANPEAILALLVENDTLVQQIKNQATEIEDTRAAYQLTRHQLDAHRAGQGTYEGITR